MHLQFSSLVMRTWEQIFFFLQSTLNLSHNVMVRFAPSVELFWCATLKKLHLDYNQLEEMTESMVKLCK